MALNIFGGSVEPVLKINLKKVKFRAFLVCKRTCPFTLWRPKKMEAFAGQKTPSESAKNFSIFPKKPTFWEFRAKINSERLKKKGGTKVDFFGALRVTFLKFENFCKIKFGAFTQENLQNFKIFKKRKARIKVSIFLRSKISEEKNFGKKNFRKCQSNFFRFSLHKLQKFENFQFFDASEANWAKNGKSYPFFYLSFPFFCIFPGGPSVPLAPYILKNSKSYPFL